MLGNQVHLIEDLVQDLQGPVNILHQVKFHGPFVHLVDDLDLPVDCRSIRPELLNEFK